MSSEATARVLCVDDNPDIADSTAMMLEAFGFDARACTDPLTALAEASEFRPAACVLDISMPGMDGYELARRLKSVLGTVFLVAVTASYGGDHERRLAAAGFDMRLIKPADPDRLFEVLERVRGETSA